MGFTRRIDIDLDYDTAIAATKAALQEQGFGILTEIDVVEALDPRIMADVSGSPRPERRRRRAARRIDVALDAVRRA